jgi:hypothetical protein
MTTIGLVGCAAAKLSRPAPARDLYTSQLFRKASAYAEANSDRWYILSAKHGLVSPDTVLEPYDMKLGHKSGPPIWAWAQMVADQLGNAVLARNIHPELLVLAGEQYRTFLRFTDYPARVPMQSMGIGQQLGYLTKELTLAHQRHTEHDKT